MINLVLLYGGNSPEHSVSCVSAARIAAAIDQSNYRVVPIGIDKNGVFRDQPLNPDWRLSDYPAVSESATAVVFDPSSKTVSIAGQQLTIDLVFPVLHGPNGEDGSVQGLLQLMQVPYVGNGVLASALAMEKSKAKAVLRDAGVRVADDIVITRSGWNLQRETELERARRFATQDVFVKPSRSGSSVGVSLVKAGSDLVPAIELALSLDQTALIEQRIYGREVECSVLEHPNGALQVSVAGEIIVHGREFYDYEAKYLSDAAELKVPTELSQAELSEMQGLAIRAFEALGCSGLARTDFFLTEDGFVLTEVNTMPGFTPISMYPSLLAEGGLSYPELVEILLQTALAKGTQPR